VHFVEKIGGQTGGLKKIIEAKSLIINGLMDEFESLQLHFFNLIYAYRYTDHIA
jgi:hypothetical protein